jgi:hypothetical protein
MTIKFIPWQNKELIYTGSDLDYLKIAMMKQKRKGVKEMISLEREIEGKVNADREVKAWDTLKYLSVRVVLQIEN